MKPLQNDQQVVKQDPVEKPEVVYPEKSKLQRAVKRKTETKELSKLQLAAGVVGKFLGLGQYALINIAGLVLILLMLAAIGALFVPTTIPAQEIWKTLIPVISMILGYLFGKKSG